MQRLNLNLQNCFGIQKLSESISHSFMFESILDMSSKHLYKVYQKVKKLPIQ